MAQQNYGKRAKKRKHYERNDAPSVTIDNNKYSSTSTSFDIVDRVQEQISPRGLLVFITDETQSPVTILQSAAEHAKCSLRFKPLNSNKSPTKWQALINDEVFAEGVATSETKARNELSPIVLKEMQKYCFTIERKYKLTEGPAVSVKAPVEEKQETASTYSGFGAKLMMKMGWKGGGLGAEEQGQQKIVEPYHQIDRQGLGNANIGKQIYNILRDYAKEQSMTSLAFSSEFTKEERKQIHSLAQKHNLRSKSYGKGENRMLVVSCKLNRWDMVMRLLEIGGECEQYKLIYPGNFT